VAASPRRVYWCPFETSAPVILIIVPAVTLTARSVATNLVELSWPLGAPGYHLEPTPSVAEPIRVDQE
jgi:hypothetical protein